LMLTVHQSRDNEPIVFVHVTSDTASCASAVEPYGIQALILDVTLALNMIEQIMSSLRAVRLMFIQIPSDQIHCHY
jgi:hypothetical protein